MADGTGGTGMACGGREEQREKERQSWLERGSWSWIFREEAEERTEDFSGKKQRKRGEGRSMIFTMALELI